jgi:hypothetical protein
MDDLMYLPFALLCVVFALYQRSSRTDGRKALPVNTRS